LLIKVSENDEAIKGLTSLEVQVDREGQVHAFTDANKTWTFVNPISVNDLVETYKEVLANVAFMELKGAR